MEEWVEEKDFLTGLILDVIALELYVFSSIYVFVVLICDIKSSYTVAEISRN